MSNLPKVQPFGSRVLIKHIDPENETIGGIHIPETSRGTQPHNNEAVVLVLGSGKDVEFVCQVGDIVIVPEYGGVKLTIEEEDYTIIEQDQLIGKKL
jgi:chaperonin GroES